MDSRWIPDSSFLTSGMTTSFKFFSSCLNCEGKYSFINYLYNRWIPDSSFLTSGMTKSFNLAVAVLLTKVSTHLLNTHKIDGSRQLTSHSSLLVWRYWLRFNVNLLAPLTGLKRPPQSIKHHLLCTRYSVTIDYHHNWIVVIC